jgi:8-amino-7-oxononanoate synthase
MTQAQVSSPVLRWISKVEQERVAAGLRRGLRPRLAGFDGLLDLASNDYLGLARDARVIRAGNEAAEHWGAGSTGSRLVSGSTALHESFEIDLAQFVSAERGLVFSSGYLANLGAITSLADKDTLVVSDALNHASLIDAIRLSGADVMVTPHCDPAAVEGALAERTRSKAMVVTDAVFSVDGDLAPLAELHSICRRAGAVLVVDEAHSVGVLGNEGRGACEQAGIAGESDVVVTVTLSKSLGAQGGAVIASDAVVSHLVDSARSFIFDTGLAPASVGSAQQALAILRREPQLAGQARGRAQDLRAIALAAGWKATDPAGAVVSLLVGEPAAAVAAAKLCESEGVRVGCFRPPSVPDQWSRLRLTARATLGLTDLDRAQQALIKAAEQLS